MKFASTLFSSQMHMGITCDMSVSCALQVEPSQHHHRGALGECLLIHSACGEHFLGDLDTQEGLDL